MQLLIKTWISLAFLLARPDALPGDQRSMKFSVICALASNLLATAVLVESGFLLAEALLDLVLAGGLLYMSLSLVGKPERFIQAFSAYCGISVVLNLSSLLLLAPSYLGQSSDEIGGFSRFLEILLLVWSIAAVAHIIRHTFDVLLSLGVGIALLYLLFYLQLASMLRAFYL